MKENTHKNKKNLSEKNPYNISYDNYMKTTSSGTECTGLIPNGEKDREDYERYKEIFSFGGSE